MAKVGVGVEVGVVPLWEEVGEVPPWEEVGEEVGEEVVVRLLLTLSHVTM